MRALFLLLLFGLPLSATAGPLADNGRLLPFKGTLQQPLAADGWFRFHTVRDFAHNKSCADSLLEINRFVREESPDRVLQEIMATATTFHLLDRRLQLLGLTDTLNVHTFWGAIQVPVEDTSLYSRTFTQSFDRELLPGCRHSIEEKARNQHPVATESPEAIEAYQIMRQDLDRMLVGSPRHSPLYELIQGKETIDYTALMAVYGRISQANSAEDRDKKLTAMLLHTLYAANLTASLLDSACDGLILRQLEELGAVHANETTSESDLLQMATDQVFADLQKLGPTFEARGFENPPFRSSAASACFNADGERVSNIATLQATSNAELLRLRREAQDFSQDMIRRHELRLD